MAPIHPTREGWLLAATEILRKELFEDRGYTLPAKMLCSCGAPVGKLKAIGQCWSPESAADGETHHLFVCPSLSDPVQVLATQLHEIIHAVVGVKEGHKGNFKKLAKEFGLAGKMTATYAAEGTDLYLKLSSIANRLGDYPHVALRKTKPGKEKKGGSGWIRLQSPKEETYRVVISPKMIEEHGLPLDPWGNEMEPVE